MNYLSYDQSGLILSLVQSVSPVSGFDGIEVTDAEFASVGERPWTWRVDLTSKMLVRRTAAEIAASAPPPTLEQVNVERDRRMYGGIVFEGSMYDSDVTSRQAVSDSGRLAFMAVMGGSVAGDLRWATAEQDFVWINAANVKVPMDAPTMVNLSRTMVASKNNLTMAARALKDMAIIPADYADDKWWT